MNKIYGEYFNCGYAVSNDSQGIVLDNVVVDRFQEWIDVATECQALGVYPRNIQDSEQHAGKIFQLDIQKVINGSHEVYFGCIEWRMGWYLFYKFTNEDIDIINNVKNYH